MRSLARLRLDDWTRHLLLWCLLLALPLQGLSAATIQLLGTNHTHRGMAAVAPFMAGWQDFRRSPHWSDSPRPAHSHEWFQRHHHALDDASVVALDAQGGESPGDVGSSAASAIWLVFPTASGLLVPRAELMEANWPRFSTAAFQSCDAKRLERPPQA
ncbi:MAG: hypothetical protein ABIQ82_09395 [Variovorax sp.]